MVTLELIYGQKVWQLAKVVWKPKLLVLLKFFYFLSWVKFFQIYWI